MTISYLVCAGRVIQDIPTNKYSYIDIFERIALPKDSPFLYQAFFVAGKLSDFKAGGYSIEIKILDPQKKVIGTVPFGNKELVDGDVPFSAYFSLLKIEKLGRHYIKVSVNGKDLADGDRHYFDVIRLGE